MQCGKSVYERLDELERAIFEIKKTLGILQVEVWGIKNDRK